MSLLLKKYNQSAPRYTSYPPVPFWISPPKEEEWISHIKASYSEKGVDLYVHVPFCEKLCYYCGCNRTITKNHSVEIPFVDLVLKEWDLYLKKLGFSPLINSIHFGGGTPTFLSSKNLERLLSNLLKNKSESFHGSIEIDPRTVKSDHMDVMKTYGITRVSLGIQDFDEKVQKAINRLQSFEMVKNVVDELRLRHFESINFDVIYGLPLQTPETIKRTFELVAELRPDMIAYYSYAHLPSKIKNQRLINEEDLPLNEEKRILYELGKKILLAAGYFDVGMDHFSLEDGFLYEAKKKGELTRNFMGYLDKKSNVLIGLGPTSISDSSMSFIQNEKTNQGYQEKIENGLLPISIGHTHSEEDKEAQRIILDLMCNEKTNFKIDELNHQEKVLEELAGMQKDGLVHFGGDQLEVLDDGKKFLRNVAMIFDHHLREKKEKAMFSQSI